MKQSLFLRFSVCLIILLCIGSCRKDDADNPQNLNSKSSQIKSFLEEQKRLTNKDLLEQVQWKNISYNNETGEYFIPYLNKIYSKNRVLGYIQAKETGDNFWQIRFVETELSKDELWDKQFFENGFLGKNFDGTISYLDAEYALEKIESYTKGSIVKLQERQVYRKGADVKKDKPIKAEILASMIECTDWYWVTYVNGQVVSISYLHTTCKYPECQTSVTRDDSGLPSMKLMCSGGPGEGGGGSNNIGYINSDSQDISNNVTNPCIHSVVDNMIVNGSKTQIQQMLQTLFNASEQVNLNIYDGEWNGSDDGVSNAAQVEGNKINLGIVLNSGNLQYSSNEYVASVVLHEAIHAYMRYYEISTPMQHESMAVSYVNKIYAALKSNYPNLNDNDADNLSWGGLQGTASYNYHLSQSKKEAITNTYQRYKTGVEGNKCP